MLQAFLEQGWQEFDEDEHYEHQWNMWWKTSRFSASDYESLLPWQRLNHYPKSTTLTKKDGLLRNVRRMQGVHGNQVYNFVPQGFNLPNDYTRFVSEFSKLRDSNNNGPIYWICKPADMSRGRGIFLFKDLSDLQYNCTAVVQRYICNPLLISGYKFDIRIYAVVTSFQPLRVYMSREGLVRFSTEKYDLSTLGNHYSHLTNSSINKHGPMYLADKERIGLGCKWTLTQLRHYLHQNHLDNGEVFAKITNIVNLTLLMQASQSVPATGCFELYGIDVIIDENMKPWLLEVNYSPALSVDCAFDVQVKKSLIMDVISLMGYTEADKDHGGSEYFQQQEHLASLALRSYVPDTKSRRGSIDAQRHGKRRNSYSRFPVIPNTLVGNKDGRHNRSGRDSGFSNNDNGLSEGEGQDSDDENTARTRKGAKMLQQTMPRKRPSGTSVGSVSRHYRSPYRPVVKQLGHKSDSGVSSCSSGASTSNSDVFLDNEQYVEEEGAGGGQPAPSLNTVHEYEDTETQSKQSESPSQLAFLAQRRQYSSPTLNQSRKTLSNALYVPPLPLRKSPVVMQNFTPVPGPSPGRESLRGKPFQQGSQISSRQPKTYDRPWRKSKPSQENSTKVTAGAIQQVEVCGDLVLLYPFNEVTKRPMKVGGDQKLLVKECHKFVKYLLSQFDSDKKGKRGEADDTKTSGHSRPSTSSTRVTSSSRGTAASRASHPRHSSKAQTSKSSTGVFSYIPDIWKPLKASISDS